MRAARTIGLSLGFATLAGSLLLLLTAAPVRADDSSDGKLALVRVGEPEGFSSLTGKQTATVDVYFGNQRLGDALVTYQPGVLTFDNPADLVAMLPNLVDRPTVLAALSAPDLSSNAQLVCTPGADRATCGRTTPPVAAVIFDQNHFRADLFVNPSLLAVTVSVPQRYLQQPQGGLSLVNGIGAILSGSSDGKRTYNIQDRFILGDADRRLRADIGYASGYGLQADRLVVEIDKPDWRYSAGAFWTLGTDLIGRRKMLGVGAETQIDTRLDKDEIRGNPLIVFLNQKARVDIVRDGRVLTSRIYEAGNQTLDTTDLPDGSYEVVLRIEEVGGDRRRERRFFTRNPRIAAMGEKILFAYAGALVDDRKSGFLSPTAIPFAQAGAARRLGPHFAVDGTLMMTDHTALGEVGGYFLAPQLQVRVAAVGSSRGDLGALVQLSFQGMRGLDVNFDLRRITAGKESPLPHVRPDLADLPIAGRSFTQASGNISYSVENAQFGVAASYRKSDGNRSIYSIGPTVRWEFFRRGALRMAFTGDLAFSDQGRSGFAGVTLSLLGGRGGVSAAAALKSERIDGEGQQTAMVGSINGSWQANNVAGGVLDLGGGYDHDLERDSLSAAASLRGEKLAVTGEAIQELGGEGRSLQYSLGLQTSVAVRGGTVAFEGGNNSDSMVVVNVDGSGPEDRFDVIVDDAPLRTISSGDRMAVALPAYRQYDIRIRPADGESLHYDGSARTVGLYPGNVEVLSWSAKPVTAIFGRLVSESGEPLSGAAVTGSDGIGETDDNGYFQIETTDGSDLNVVSPDGQTCSVALPAIEDAKDYVPVGTLVCRAPEVGLHLSLADAP